MFKFKFSLLCSFLLVFFIFSGFAPLDSYYIDLNTSELGEIRVYFSKSYSTGSFSLSDGIPVNISGSQITGYVLNSSGSRIYNIYAAVYGEQWTYRSTSNNYGSSDLHIISCNIDTSSIEFFGLVPPSDTYYLVWFTFLIGSLIIIVWIRR